jgi:hypothetical protein
LVVGTPIGEEEMEELWMTRVGNVVECCCCCSPAEKVWTSSINGQ